MHDLNALNLNIRGVRQRSTSARVASFWKDDVASDIGSIAENSGCTNNRNISDEEALW